MKHLDYPPVWLVAFLALGWGVGRLQALFLPPETLPQPVFAIGAVLVSAGLVFMLLAAPWFVRRRTTIVPRRAATALITEGVYRFSRNPIYLGDALLLAGMLLWWGAVLALPLVAAFMLVIQRRFIASEEAQLAKQFPQGYAAYCRSVRRWI